MLTTIITAFISSLVTLLLTRRHYTKNIQQQPEAVRAYQLNVPDSSLKVITCTNNQAYRKSNDITFSKAVSAYQLNDSDSSLKVITCIDNQAYGKNNNMTFSKQYNPVQPKADVSIYSEPDSVSNELVYNSAYFECNLHSDSHNTT